MNISDTYSDGDFVPPVFYFDEPVPQPVEQEQESGNWWNLAVILILMLTILWVCLVSK